MKRALIFDTETTGLVIPAETNLNKQPHIIELGIVEIFVDNDCANINHIKSWLINPGVELTDEITKITGLKDEDLRDQLPFSGILEELISDWFLGAHILVAHNLPFDHSMLLFELQRLGKEYAFPYPPKQLCTVQEFMHLESARLKLVDLYEKVLGKKLNQTHRALDDARALAEIVLKEGLLLK